MRRRLGFAALGTGVALLRPRRYHPMLSVVLYLGLALVSVMVIIH